MNRGADSQKSKAGGYTIVETLIFLAVSGLLLTTAMLFISGQQAKQQFQSSVREFESRLADIANDVSTGYYQNGTPLECSATSGEPVFSGVSPRGLGENTDCIFVGTVVKLGSGSSAGREEMIQYTMAGRRLNAGSDVVNLAEARPRVVDVAGAYTTGRIGREITIACVAKNAPSCTEGNSPDAAVGFFTTFKGTGINQERGSAVATNLVSYGSVSIEDNDAQTKPRLNQQAFYNNPSLELNPYITICLSSNETNQYALVRVGSNGSSKLTVSSEIKRRGTLCG